jgi:NAD(P)H dehydrogenase (quinone)
LSSTNAGHPDKNSYCAKLAVSLHNASQSKYSNAKLLNLYDLTFNMNLIGGYSDAILEADLVHAQNLIHTSDHLVFVYPTWWWSMPALLKGFIDRVFIPGFAFKYEGHSGLPAKLLTGKTATLVVTMDSPAWYYTWWMKSVGHVMMKKGVLAFCGISKTRIVTIANHRKLNTKEKESWINRMSKYV